MENKSQKIEICLCRNLLTLNNPTDYIARINNNRILSTKDVCVLAVKQSKSGLSPSILEYAVELFFSEMSHQLCNGFTVDTGYFNATPTVNGLFKNVDEKFNRDKHNVIFQFYQGENLREKSQDIDIIVNDEIKVDAIIQEVKDYKSGTTNDVITPGGYLDIYGYKIKISGSNPINGIYFVNTATNERTPVPVKDIHVNDPTSLTVLIPRLVNGAYYVEVVTQYSGSDVLLSWPATRKLERKLTVIKNKV